MVEQTAADWELIAIDDGSTDDTFDRLLRWQARDRRIHPLRRAHAGIIPSLNAGLALCQGDLIARMDADDHSHPQRLAAQAALLAARPELAAVGCLVEGFPQSDVRLGFRIYLEWLNRLVEPAEIAREFFIESPLPHPSLMLRRTWLEQLGGYQEHGWPEDYDLLLRMHVAGAVFAKVPQTLLFWREHPGRLTRTDGRYSVENFLRAKAAYLSQGPLRGRQSLIIWGAGQMGKRLSKYLLDQPAALEAFIDVDEKKFGRQRRGRPILPPGELPALWKTLPQPVLLAAVRSRGARALIREQLLAIGLREGEDWWAVA